MQDPLESGLGPGFYRSGESDQGNSHVAGSNVDNEGIGLAGLHHLLMDPATLASVGIEPYGSSANLGGAGGILPPLPTKHSMTGMPLAGGRPQIPANPIGYTPNLPLGAGSSTHSAYLSAQSSLPSAHLPLQGQTPSQSPLQPPSQSQSQSQPQLPPPLPPLLRKGTSRDDSMWSTRHLPTAERSSLKGSIYDAEKLHVPPSLSSKTMYFLSQGPFHPGFTGVAGEILPEYHSQPTPPPSRPELSQSTTCVVGGSTMKGEEDESNSDTSYVNRNDSALETLSFAAQQASGAPLSAEMTVRAAAERAARPSMSIASLTLPPLASKPGASTMNGSIRSNSPLSQPSSHSTTAKNSRSNSESGSVDINLHRMLMVEGPPSTAPPPPKRRHTSTSSHGSTGSMSEVYKRVPKPKQHCSKCDKWFADLVAHEAVHMTDGSRPNICATCGRGFARPNDLNRHQRSHVRTAPFRCPLFFRMPDQNCDGVSLDANLGLDPGVSTPCHQTGEFTRGDTYKNHLRSLHFEYPKGVKKNARAGVGGRCKGCGLLFSNSDDWIRTHIESGECMAITKIVRARARLGDNAANINYID